MRNSTDIKRAVTDQIIQGIQKGDLPPWRKPFCDDPNGPGLHTSLSTGKSYRGINQLILQATAMQRRYKSKWWGTFNQIRHHNASVRKGEKGHRVILWKPIKRTRANELGKEVDDSFLVMREFVIFNVEQTTGLDQFRVGYSTPKGTVVERYTECDELIEATEAKIEYGTNQPCYRPNDDLIELPFRNKFESSEAFYEVAFHELIHWTAKKERMGRTEDKYAFEELVAEIGACLLMSQLGLSSDNFSNNAAYIQSWLRGLENDTRYIFEASAAANKAVDFILSSAKQEAEAEEPIPF